MCRDHRLHLRRIDVVDQDSGPLADEELDHRHAYRPEALHDHPLALQ
jgi:hypothetical protein